MKKTTINETDKKLKLLMPYADAIKGLRRKERCYENQQPVSKEELLISNFSLLILYA